MSKYKFTPKDVASLLYISDFTHLREKEIIEDLFREHNNSIIVNYRNDFDKFRRVVHEETVILELDDCSFSETDMILRVYGLTITDDNIDNVFGQFFRLVKLQILYSQSGYKRLKLRSILKEFGYKRRSDKLNFGILKALKALGLVTYLRGLEPCDITEINLDQMVIIRLK